MNTPNILHVTWNAADAHQRFYEAGIDKRPGDTLSATEVTTVLARQLGTFVLQCRSEAPPASLTMRLTSMPGRDTFAFKSIEEPELEETVQVASEPPPRISEPHGDYLFDLVSVVWPNSSAQS